MRKDHYMEGTPEAFMGTPRYGPGHYTERSRRLQGRRRAKHSVLANCDLLINAQFCGRKRYATLTAFCSVVDFAFSCEPAQGHVGNLRFLLEDFWNLGDVLLSSFGEDLPDSSCYFANCLVHKFPFQGPNLQVRRKIKPCVFKYILSSNRPRLLHTFLRGKPAFVKNSGEQVHCKSYVERYKEKNSAKSKIWTPLKRCPRRAEKNGRFGYKQRG